MGARGRKPKPSALKQLDGTYRADRAAAHEPMPVGLPSCPRFLSDDGRREFRRVTKMLSEMGLIGRIDGNALARYAATWVRWRKASDMLEKTGELQVFKDEKGKPKAIQPSPLGSVVRSLAEQLDRLESAFGMNPSARSRINVTPPTATDELADFLNGGGHE